MQKIYVLSNPSLCICIDYTNLDLLIKFLSTLVNPAKDDDEMLLRKMATLDCVRLSNDWFVSLIVLVPSGNR